MSRANIERLHAGYAAFNRREFDAVAAMLHPDVEWDASEQFDGRVYRGRDGFAEYVKDVFSYWDYWQLEIDECRDVDDHVVVLGSVHAQNPRFKLPVQIRVAWHWTLRDLLGVYMRIYLNPDHALDSVGLRE